MRAEVKAHHGTPTVFLDGRPIYANFNLLSPFDGEYRAPSLHVPRKFGNLGVHLYSIDSLGPEWPGPREGHPGPYDFSSIQPRLQAVLDQDPDAHFLLRMSFETRGLLNNWWNLAHPDELEFMGAEYEDAAAIARARLAPEPWRCASQSYASTAWRTQSKALLRGYIQHLREVGLYDRVIAYQIAAGVVGEWVKGDSDMADKTGDYSAPMRRHFQAWLRRKYGHYVYQLRKAWDDDAVNFDSADVPSPQEQFKCRHGLFRDPTREQKVIDYFACRAELCADVLISFCQTVKEETQGEKLTGAFFGYLMELAWNINFFGFLLDGPDFATIQRSGHLGLSKVLRSPHIDFFVSPYAYPFRGVGGDNPAMQPTESLRLHNKIYLSEEDTLMHNRFEPDGRMQEVKDTLAIYKRNFAHCLAHGHGITWLQSSYFPEYSEIEKEADALHAQMQQIGTWALQLDRAPQAEIAVFLDDDSYFYESLQNSLSLPGVFYQRVINLPRIGAPHDVYLLRDLVEGKVAPRRLNIFLNAFRLTRAQRDAIAAQIKRDGHTALWLYASGYIYDDAASPAIPPPKAQPMAPLHLENMRDLTGIAFGKADSSWPVHMHITDFQHEITRAIPQDLFWGTQRALSPIIHVDDPEARALGQMITVMGRSQTGLALKEFPSWRSIYSSTPNLPAPVLRGIARYAGVHLYSEAGDVLYATSDLLAVHSSGGGPRCFKLPRPVELVYDLFERKEIARASASAADSGVREFEVILPPASTMLFYTGAAAQLQGLERPAET